jgi:uncharacterized protein (DUF433 family)
MPSLEKIFSEILELDRVERELLFFRLVHLSGTDLGPGRSMSEWLPRSCPPEHPLIVSTPGICGGAARMIRTRIPVWTLERLRQLGVSESDILGSYPSLQAADLVQAWSYVSHNKDEIETSIRENEED